MPIHERALRGAAVGGFFGNLLLNGAMAWLLFPPVAALPLFARGNCVAGDTVGTSFFMSLITCLVLTPAVRRTLAPKGNAPPIARASLPLPARLLPGNAAARGSLVGLVAALTCAPLALAALSAAGVAAMSRGEVTLYKAIYTAIVGVVITPLFALRALADAEPARGA